MEHDPQRSDEHAENRSSMGQIDHVAVNFDEIEIDAKRRLLTPIDTIDWSVRARNVLAGMNVVVMGQLAQQDYGFVWRQPNLGRKTMKEFKNALTGLKLSFGLEIDNWPQQEDLPSIVLLVSGDETGEEHGDGVGKGPDFHTIDFERAGEDLRNDLLKPIDMLDISVRARNVAVQMNARVIGQLAMMERETVFSQPNVGRKTLKEFEDVLDTRGLSFGTEVRNWPDDQGLGRLLDIRESKDLDREPVSFDGVEFLEDELLAVVNAAVDPRHQTIFLRRYGWDGGLVMTLEDLGNDPDASGLGHVVTRERIRQIEVKATLGIRRRKFPTPILDRAIAEIIDRAPILITDMSRVLHEAGVTRTKLNLGVLNSAMELLGKEWGEDVTLDWPILAPSDEAEIIEDAWRKMWHVASQHDFASIDDVFVDTMVERSETARVAEMVVAMESAFAWLDRESGIFCSMRRIDRGRCRIIKICRKIFAVTSELSVGRLHQAIRKARTLEDEPSPEILKRILVLDRNFELQGDMVYRSSSFEPGGIRDSDVWMIDAARELGTITHFTSLRRHLVRQGLSSNNAQVLIYRSPLWIAYSRGRYRFVASTEDLDALVLTPDDHSDDIDDEEGTAVEFDVSHRHLVAGTHWFSDADVSRGRWRVFDGEGNDFGAIEVAKNRLSGLRGVFERASVDVGNAVKFSFSEEDKTAVIRIE